MAATYNLAGNGNSAQLKENPDGTVTISNSGKTGTFQKSQVSNYLGTMDKAVPTNNVTQTAVPDANSTPRLNPVDEHGMKKTSGEQSLEVPAAPAAPTVPPAAAPTVANNATAGAQGQSMMRTENGVTTKYYNVNGQWVTEAEYMKDEKPTAASAQTAASDAGSANVAAIKGVQAGQATPATVSPEEKARIERDNAAEKTALDKSEAASSEASDLEKKALVERNKRDQELSVQLSDLENQKIKDEQAAAQQKMVTEIATAKRDVAVQESIAALSMAKLGLTHSGSSVATFQSIATQGFQKLAQIEADFTLANSKLAYEAQKNRLGLQKDLNKIMDDSNDKLIENRKNTAIRIADYQKNLLMSDSKKEKAIKDALNEAKEEKRKTEDRTLALSQSLVDAANARADRLKKLDDENKATASKSIDTLVSTGQWLRMGDAERLKMEQDAGVPVGSTYSKVGSQAATDFRELVDGLGVKGYFPSISQTDAFTKDVVSYMKLGDSKAEAVNKAFSKYVSGDSKLQAILKKAAGSGSGSAKETYVNLQTKAKDAAGVTYDRTVEVPRSWVLAQRKKGLTGDQIADAASSYGIPVKESAMPEDKKTKPGTRTTRYETRDGKLYKVTTQDNRTLYDEEVRVRATAGVVPGYNEALGSGSQDGENQEDEENE